MRPTAHEDIITALNRLAAQLQTAKPHRPCRGRGRPSLLHIRRTYIRKETYLEPDMVSALDRLAADMEQRSGRRTHRGDIVRLAIAEYVQRHLRGAEI